MPRCDATRITPGHRRASAPATQDNLPPRPPKPRNLSAPHAAERRESRIRFEMRRTAAGDDVGLRILGIDLKARGEAAAGLRLDRDVAKAALGVARDEELHPVRAQRAHAVEEDEAEVFLIGARVLRAAGADEAAAKLLLRGRQRLTSIAEGIQDPSWRERFLSAVPAHRELMRTAQGL